MKYCVWSWNEGEQQYYLAGHGLDLHAAMDLLRIEITERTLYTKLEVDEDVESLR
jgi:hypothetical protein